MAILAHKHILEALESGAVRLPTYGKIGAFSLDIPLGATLLHPRRGITPLPEEGLVVTPDDFYLWEFPSDLFLSAGYMGEVVTRSTYARLGVCAESAPSNDAFILQSDTSRSFRPVCSLRTFGTEVRIRPGEFISQLVLKTSLSRCSTSEMRDLFDQGELVMYKGDKRLSRADVTFHEGIELLLDPIIYVYRKGSSLDPRQPAIDYDFEKIDLSRFPHGYYLAEGSFFISSSVQKIATSNRYVSYFTPHRTTPTSSNRVTQSLHPGHTFFSLPFRTHPNAPYHVFGLHALRQITFENYVTSPGGVRLFPREKQAELMLVPLIGPSNYDQPSRYHEQRGATLMRNEI